MNWELVIVDCLSSLAGNAGIGCIAVVELVADVVILHNCNRITDEFFFKYGWSSMF